MKNKKFWILYSIWFIIYLFLIFIAYFENINNALQPLIFFLFFPLIIYFTIFAIKHSKTQNINDAEESASPNFNTDNSARTSHIKAPDKLQIKQEPMEIKSNTNNFSFTKNQRTNIYKEIYINPKFHKIPDEISLSTKFFINNMKWLQEYEDRIYNSSSKSFDKTYSIEKQINFCSEAIKDFYALKEICYCNSEGGKLYFQEHWEQCHNSKNPCFSYIDRVIERRDYLVKYYDILSDFSNIIIETIKNNPGLLQKNIYSLINIDLKSEIQKEIRTLEQSGLITRTPKSGTYILEVKSASLENSADSIKTTNTAQEIEKAI